MFICLSICGTVRKIIHGSTWASKETGEGKVVKNPSLYTDHAELYDAIYSFKPYESEAKRLHELLARLGVDDNSAVLEAACGTGNYLSLLQRWYRISGFDLNECMLEIAKKKSPDADLFVSDMTNFSVEEPSDALLCLFSSIAYLHTEQQLRSAALCFARALRPGGILIIEPFVSKEQFASGRPYLQCHDGEELKCARACVSEATENLAVLDFHWMVLRPGQSTVERFEERHVLRLYDRDSFTRIFEESGFSMSIESRGLHDDRELLVGRKT